jgi:hypothetical protein
VALRVKKLEQIRGEEQAKIYKDILDAFVYEAAARIRKSATDAVNSFAEGDEYTKLKNAVEILTSLKPVNIKNARRHIAAKLIEDNIYSF